MQCFYVAFCLAYSHKQQLQVWHGEWKKCVQNGFYSVKNSEQKITR